MPHSFPTGKRTRASATKVTSITDERLPGKPTPKFVYAHHPNSWEFHLEHGWIPYVKKIPLVPGVNGCRKGARGVQPVLTRLASEGWIVIDEDCPIVLTGSDGDLIKDNGYLYRWEGIRGAIYQDAWSSPSVIGTGPAAKVDWQTQYDRVGFAAWRAMLVEKRLVPPASAAVLAEAVKVQTTRSRRRLAEGHDGNPHVQAQVKREMSKLDAMIAAARELGAVVKGHPSSAKPEKVGRV